MDSQVSFESLSLSLSLFAGYMLIICNWMMYGMCSSGAVNTLCCVWKFSCIFTSHSFMPIIMSINDACNLISTHQ